MRWRSDRSQQKLVVPALLLQWADLTLPSALWDYVYMFDLCLNNRDLPVMTQTICARLYLKTRRLPGQPVAEMICIT